VLMDTVVSMVLDMGLVMTPGMALGMTIVPQPIRVQLLLALSRSPRLLLINKIWNCWFLDSCVLY
jgi:hypothetical protein